MVYDCFTFFNELDLLEIRLNTLKDVVDCFVIAEATRTHRGKPKELFFEKNRERYASFLDRIRYIVVDNLLSEEEVDKDAYNLPWVNENRQRNALIRGLIDAKDRDVIMVSDLDEIPRSECVQKAVSHLASGTKSVRLGLDAYCFYINFRNYSYPNWLLGTSAVKYGDFLNEDLFKHVKCDRYTQVSENIGNTVQKLRFLKSERVFRHAGWHFSYLGGVEAIKRKIAAFSHVEFASLSDELLRQRLMSGDDLFGRVGKSFGVPFDSSLPEFVGRNMKRFRDLIFDVDEHYMHKTRCARWIAYFRGLIYRAVVGLIPPFAAPYLVRMRDFLMKWFGRV